MQQQQCTLCQQFTCNWQNKSLFIFRFFLLWFIQRILLLHCWVSIDACRQCRICQPTHRGTFCVELNTNNVQVRPCAWSYFYLAIQFIYRNIALFRAYLNGWRAPSFHSWKVGKQKQRVRWIVRWIYTNKVKKTTTHSHSQFDVFEFSLELQRNCRHMRKWFVILEHYIPRATTKHTAQR